ncbi:Glucan 1,3-beta-glucosidase 3 [Ceratobasidium sp. 392]|nr:Glucan 1,3-beta-glucosidase 3 [Ceratobasidium sp. 392]
MESHISAFPVPIAPRPSKENGYVQRQRPLSFQPRFSQVKTQPLNNYGFPEPGIQSPTARQVIAKDYLISDETWEDVCNNAQDIDFIVIGSGFTALAFIEQTLKRDPFKKIICLERGDFWLPDHFQNLPLPFKYTLGGPSETFPFTLSKETYKSEVRFVHGSCPFFGGRSTFWSAWSPSPTPELMRNWPKSLVETSQKEEFFERASKLLRVTSASDIGPPYAKLQTQVDDRLKKGVENHQVPSADEAYPAPMAVSSIAQTSVIHFTKFSTPGPLLGLYKQQQKRAEAKPKPKGSPLLFATETSVEYLVTEVGFPPPSPPGAHEEVVQNPAAYDDSGWIHPRLSALSTVMIVSAAAATQILAAALPLQQASYSPAPSLLAGSAKRFDTTASGLGNQFLAGEDSIVKVQGVSCRVDDYNAPDIQLPQFAPYDEETARVYRYRKQLSVNLGSWFVQENWMKPSLVECASGAKSSELDIATGWDNPRSARSVLERHWDTWIKEADFAWLEERGINTVRLPIGYWSLGPQYCLGTPFEEVAKVYEQSWPRVLRAIEWAANHNIGVLVDLHGAVGSQNGQSHSGTSDGQMNLFDDDENIKKTTDVLVYLTKQLLPISNVVGIQILNEPRNVASLPDFYGRTIDMLRKISPEAAKFPFYIHDGFNLERFAKFVEGRKDFVVQDHHSYFVFTPSDSSTPAKEHTSNINNGIRSALASASKKARHNLVVDEWSCALTPQSLSPEKKQLSARKSFCTSQANVYMQETAGWSFWSYKTENCDSEDGWCFRKAVGRSLPANFSVWDVAEIKKAGKGRDGVVGLLSAVEGLERGVIGDVLERSLRETPYQSGVPAYISSVSSDVGTGGTAKDPASDWTAPLGPPAPDADDMMTASVVPDTDNIPLNAATNPARPVTPTFSSLATNIKRMLGLHVWTTGSGSTAARRAAQANSSGKKVVKSEDKGYDDGFAAAIAFNSFGGSRLGFATQYMEDNIAALLSSNSLPDGGEDGYRKGFVRGLADGEKQVMKDML